MTIELLTPAEMSGVDRAAIAAGPWDGVKLMGNAGRKVAALVLQRYPSAPRIDVLCGPGNNGGDAYVAAQVLLEAGIEVSVWSDRPPRPGSDAEAVARRCATKPRPLSEFAPSADALVIDGLYGAGLARALPDVVHGAIERIRLAGATVVAIDLPSGVSGETGQMMGDAFDAALTVTFVRKKPGHLLYPGRQRCGETVVVDIGIADATVDAVRAKTFENRPELWLQSFPSPAADTHKYLRGHVGVFSGGPSATGAARLSALAAARAGAGAVTLLSQASAMQVNAAHLTSIMLRRADSVEEVEAFVADRKPSSLVFGPGLEAREKTGTFFIELLSKLREAPETIVVDASALTALAQRPAPLFEATRRAGAPQLLLTPHEGEFSRLFPDIASDGTLSKLDKARRAADRANAAIVYKGPDTVIASPDGRAAINGNGTPWLATAGSGDVLSGLCAGLLAQGMPVFDAACAAVWMHAEAGERFGAGLIAEDLPLAILPVIKELLAAKPARGKLR